jgi:hypothetical protein
LRREPDFARIVEAKEVPEPAHSSFPEGVPMRRYLLVLPFLIACAGSDTPPADSAAAATPAALTEADVAGSWSGTLNVEGDTAAVSGHWSDVCGAGTCRLTTTENPKDTVTLTYVIEGDSLRYNAAPHPDPMAGGAMVTDEGVARIAGNQINGNGMIKLADRPDSVVARYRFTGTKAP